MKRGFAFAVVCLFLTTSVMLAQERRDPPQRPPQPPRASRRPASRVSRRCRADSRSSHRAVLVVLAASPA